MPRTRVPVEIEAKLLVSRERDLHAITRLTALGPYRLRRRATARLHSVYIDTPSFTLARHGIALRLRRHAGNWELTAKWGGRVDGVVHRRVELTVPLVRPPRFPFVLDGSLHPRVDALVVGAALQPLLITRVYRRRLDVFAPTAGPRHPTAELAVDRVSLRAPHVRTSAVRYAEIEIERMWGTARDVTVLARLLGERFALRPSTESKFARGLRALYGRDFRGRVRMPRLS